MKLTSLLAAALWFLFSSGNLMGSPTVKELDKLLKKYRDLNAKVSKLAAARYVLSAPSLCEGRLTTESGVPVSTSDRSNQSTVYFTPYVGNKVALYTGAVWVVRSFTELSVSLSGLTADTNYDIYLYDNAGTAAIDTTLVAWSSDVARAADLVLQNGVYVKPGDATRRYVGTIRATSATQTQDTQVYRYIFSWCNSVDRFLTVSDTADSWTYATDSWRVANNSASAKRVFYVSGVDQTLIYARAMALITNSTGSLNYYASGVGIDSSSANSATIRGSGSSNTILNQVWSEYRGYPGKGFHTLYWLERGHTSTITVYGDNGDNTRYQSGLIAELAL